MDKTEEFRTKVGVFLTLLITTTDYETVTQIGKEFEEYLNSFHVTSEVEEKIKAEALSASGAIVAVNFAGDEKFFEYIQNKLEERRAENPLHDIELALGYASTGRQGTRLDLSKVLPPDDYRELMKEATEQRRAAFNN